MRPLKQLFDLENVAALSVRATSQTTLLGCLACASLRPSANFDTKQPLKTGMSTYMGLRDTPGVRFGRLALSLELVWAGR